MGQRPGAKELRRRLSSWKGTGWLLPPEPPKEARPPPGAQPHGTGFGLLTSGTRESGCTWFQVTELALVCCRSRRNKALCWMRLGESGVAGDRLWAAAQSVS